MAKKVKFYAVKKGSKTGIFHSWLECEEAIKGFSGSEYKSFETEEEANAYLQDKDIFYDTYILPFLNKKSVVAFTDGSYNPIKNKYGSGIYILTPEDKFIELSKSGKNEKYIDSKNIVGEIFAVLDAIDWAWKNDYKSIAIFFDYEGLEKWVSSEWKAKNNLTKFYQKKISALKEIIHIEFVKIKAHSNNKYNDKADKLAKSAVNENKVLKDFSGNSGYIINRVDKDAIENLINRIAEDNQNINIQKHSNYRWTLELGKERLTITLFNNIKLQVQGKLSSLFIYITTRIIEEIASDEFIEILKSAYTMSIDKNKVENSFQEYLPNLVEKNLPDALIALLKQAIINIDKQDKNDIEFSMYAFPVLRALEGILKLNLAKCNIHMTDKQGFKMFKKDKLKNKYCLKDEHCEKISKNNQEKLENCYNFLINNRHTLFHMTISEDIATGTRMIDTIDDVAAGTRMIDTKEDANHIIIEALNVANNNYIN